MIFICSSLTFLYNILYKNEKFYLFVDTIQKNKREENFMIILETSRLLLKTIEKEDTQILYDLIFSDDNTMKYTFGKKAFTLEETKKFIYKNFCKNNAIIGFAPLFEKTTGQIIGMSGVLKSENLGINHYEFGCIIAKDFRRKGYAQEVVISELTFIKKRLKQNKAYALVDKDDIASKNLLKKIGMSFQKTIILKEREEKEVYTKSV